MRERHWVVAVAFGFCRLAFMPAGAVLIVIAALLAGPSETGCERHRSRTPVA